MADTISASVFSDMPTSSTSQASEVDLEAFKNDVRTQQRIASISQGRVGTPAFSQPSIADREELIHTVRCFYGEDVLQAGGEEKIPTPLPELLTDVEGLRYQIEDHDQKCGDIDEQEKPTLIKGAKGILFWMVKGFRGAKAMLFRRGRRTEHRIHVSLPSNLR